MANSAGSIRKQQQKIKDQMRDDIQGTQSLANQLTGKEEVGTKKLREGKKSAETAKPATVDTKKLGKFLDFMEGEYRGGLSKIEIKRKI